MAELFGFKITRVKEGEGSGEGFTTPSPDDGAVEVSGAGHFASVLDLEGKTKSDDDLIRRYRDIAQQAECDMAVEDIVNEAIVADEADQSVSPILENVPVPENIKRKIRDEFNNILSLLHFQKKGHDVFRRWYVDSKIYYHIIVDNENLEKGIKELRSIDPIKIKKVKKVNKEQRRVGNNTIPFVKNIEEFFIYTNTDKNATMPTSMQGIKIAKDSVCYAHSGMIDYKSNQVIGYLQKVIRPLNMLRQIEDAVVIYRISRAPERRIFYVDVGNLPKNKAEQYLRDIMNRYRNKLTYDSSTGEIKDDRDHLHMLEDFWMPRREGGRGTEITTLDGGQNLGEMEDVNYLLKKLFRSLNIPISRMETENGFNMGRSAEITRDEVKFSKFIDKIRMRFCDIFLQLLKIQLILKGVMTEKDWNLLSPNVRFEFNKDSYFNELKETEIMKERLDVITQLDEYVGKYYSTEWIRKNVLRQSDEDISMIDDQIKKEMAKSEDQSEEQEGEDE